MLLVHKFQYKADKVTNIILSSLTYASARLFNVGNYERHNFKELGFDINQKNISLISGDGIESLKILYAIFAIFIL